MTSTIKVDTISENTSANGVAVDGVTIKDGNVGAAGTATSVAGITLYTNSDSIYTHDVSGTDDTAADNVAIGVNAMDAITTGDKNIAIGKNAGGALNTRDRNVLIGDYTGDAATDAQYTVGVGNDAFTALPSGNNNAAV